MNEGPSETTAIWVLVAAVAAVAIAALWLLAGVSSALFGSGWTTASPGRLVAVPFAFGGHLGDPRLAWPAPARGAMPGAVGVYASAALLLGVGGTAAVAVARLVADKVDLGQLLGRKGHRAHSARWARPRDLQKLRVAGPQRGRLILGRVSGRLIAAEPRQSVIVFGPTGSYKTAGLAIPALREWDGPVVATSVKTDLVTNTLEQRRERGKVWIFDPAQVTSLPRSMATPLVGCDKWRGAIKLAHWLTSATKTSSGIENADFWYATAERLLAPLLFAAATSGRPIADVLRWVEEGKGALDEVNEALAAAKVSAAKRAWAASWSREERQQSSIRTTAETIVAAYADPFVAAQTSRAEYMPSYLLDGGSNTLFLCAPETEQERLQPLFSALIQQLLDAAYGAASARGPLDPPLLVLLDEAANIAPIPNLDGLASTGAGQGIQLVTVFQDFAQVRKRYGESANTVVNNHGARLFTPGVGDPETLRYISDVTGSAEFADKAYVRGDSGHHSTSEGTRFHPIAPPGEVREGETESALLIYRDLPPTRIKLRPYHKERTLYGHRPQTGKFFAGKRRGLDE